MASPNLSATTSRSTFANQNLWLLLYWLAGGVIGLLYLQPTGPLSYSIQSQSHAAWIAIGLIITSITNWAYGRISEDGGRSLDLPTLIAFPLLNGLFETLWFLAAFKLGASLAALYSQNLVWEFLAGFMLLFIYSGVIHAFFWLKLLPLHLNRDPNLALIKRIWMLGLLATTLLWAWLYLAFADVWTVVGLHTLVDVAMVLSIRYSLRTSSAATKPM